MIKTILVTGGAGYIGSHTVKELLKQDYKVIVYDSLENGYPEAVLPPAKLIIGDLANKEKLNKVFKENKIDAVIHFAGYIEAGESVKNPGKYFYNNVANGLNLLEAMIANNVNKIVFSSSAAVYGEPENIPILETDKKEPTNTYGLTKLMFEQILNRYEIAYGLKSISLRYFNAAGADPEGQLGENHKPESHLIPLILKAALGKRENVKIFGTDYDTPDGTCIRDYIHVCDLAQAHILALEKLFSNSKSTTYNLGNGQGFSVKEVINLAKKITRIDFPVIETERRAGDPARLVASSEKAKKELGWQPRYSDLETIIKTAWEWEKRKI